MGVLVAIQLSLATFGAPVIVYERALVVTVEAPTPPLGDVDSWREYLRGKMEARKTRAKRRNLAQLAWWTYDQEIAGYRRPRNLLECVAEGIGTRLPCPWYSCRYHLGLDDGSGVLKLRIDPDDLENHETCAMAVANRFEERGLQVGEVAELMNLSEGSIEAVERVAKWKLSTMLGGNFKDWE